MDRKKTGLTVAVMFASLAAGTSASLPRLSASDAGLLTSRVWIETTAGDDPRGVAFTFLPNGILLRASCSTGYSISTWSYSGPRTLAWLSDGATVSADIISVSTVELVLDRALGETKQSLIYTAGKAPFRCS